MPPFPEAEEELIAEGYGVLQSLTELEKNGTTESRVVRRSSLGLTWRKTLEPGAIVAEKSRACQSSLRVRVPEPRNDDAPGTGKRFHDSVGEVGVRIGVGLRDEHKGCRRVPDSNPSCRG